MINKEKKNVFIQKQIQNFTHFSIPQKICDVYTNLEIPQKRIGEHHFDFDSLHLYSKYVRYPEDFLNLLD